MVALQKLYMLVLNNIFKITGRLSERTRDGLFFLMILSMELVMLFFQYLTKIGSSFGYKELFFVNTALLCLAIVFSIKEELHFVEWKKWLFYAWFVCGILIALPLPDLAGRGTFILFGLTVSFIFPALFFAWNNREDYENLYRLVAMATVISTVIFFVGCALKEPFVDGLSYKGLTTNSNLLGMSAIGGAASSLALVCNEKRLKYLYILIFELLVAFIWISGSRASLLTILVGFIVFLIGRIRMCTERGRVEAKRFVVELAVMILLTAITPIALEKIMSISYETIKQETVTTTIDSIEEIEKADNISDNSTADMQYTMTEKMQKNGDASSGRIIIWKYYIKNLQMIGHSRANGDPYIEELRELFPAHNVYLEIGYRSGIFAGLLFAGIAIASAVWSLLYLFRKRSFDEKTIFVAIMIFAFGIISNLENGVYPIQRIYVLLYYFALIPIFSRNNSLNG